MRNQMMPSITVIEGEIKKLKSSIKLLKKSDKNCKIIPKFKMIIEDYNKYLTKLRLP